MGSVTDDWVSTEFDRVDFGDERLNKRFRSLVIDLLGRCGNTLASSFGSWSKIKASYRFFANPRVTYSSMLEPHIAASVSRLRNCSTALVLQDTTYFDFSARKQAKGLDLVHRGSHGVVSKGLMLHNTLAVTTEGIPLGILDQRFIDRKSLRKNGIEVGRGGDHREEPVKKKESQRWIDVIRACHDFDVGDCRMVHVCDREGDFYELFRDATSIGEHILIRASRNRAINKEKRRDEPTTWLFDELLSRRAQGRTTVRLQVNGLKKYREATLSIIYMPFSMPPPRKRTVNKDGELPMFKLTAIMAVERKVAKSHDRLCWVLLTDLPISSTEQAIEKVHWYTKRWNIEVFHKVLKSGCAVEKAQLETADRLKNYIVLKSVVACRLFWLTRMSQENEEASCDAVLDKLEWSLLHRKFNKTRAAPSQVPTLKQVMIWIARLGGYIARPKDPPPGVTSIWRGWERLAQMVDDYHDIYG